MLSFQTNAIFKRIWCLIINRLSHLFAINVEFIKLIGKLLYAQQSCAYSLLSKATVGALIRNVGPSESMIRLSFNMAAASHTWFRNEEF